MPKKGENISLTSYDDLFETDESRAESQLERVQNIPVRELVPFKNHPFKVLDDEAMLRTTESIAEYGVLTPLIADLSIMADTKSFLDTAVLMPLNWQGFLRCRFW